MKLSRVSTVCLLVFSLCSFACTSTREYSTITAYGLTNLQLLKLVRAATDADPSAAERLSSYYLFVANDAPSALYWLRVAARNGSKDANRAAHSLERIMRE